MIRIFKTEDGTIHEKQEMQPGSWIALTNPTASEIIDVADACRIDPDHLKAPLDEEERSRIEAESNSKSPMILRRVVAVRFSIAMIGFATP